MTSFRRLSRTLALPLIAVLIVSWMPLGAAQAGLVTTDQIITQNEAAADRAKVAAFLARDDVRAELGTLGLAPGEVDARVAALSDAEIAKIAGRIDEAPAGGLVGELIGAAVLIFIILLITDLAGATDVFPFVKSQR